VLNEVFKLKREGKVVGFTASTFDLLHAGHCAMLAEAKTKCDYLIVGLMTDPTIDRPKEKNKPVQSTLERWIQVSAVDFVDLVIPYDTEQDLIDLLLLIKPDIRIIGEEYRNTNFTGKDIKGIEIYYNKREHSFSTSSLRSRVKDAEIKK
jgi:glycerol-3-phosphate cytidylyltransferase